MNERDLDVLVQRLERVWTPLGCTAQTIREEREGHPQILLALRNGLYFCYTAYPEYARFILRTQTPSLYTYVATRTCTMEHKTYTR